MFVKGEMYYRVTFPEKNNLYPNIQCLIYIGKNLSDEDEEDSWYFQSSNSFAQYGSVLYTTKGNRAVSILTIDSIEDDMFDLVKLISILEELSKARKILLQTL